MSDAVWHFKYLLHTCRSCGPICDARTSHSAAVSMPSVAAICVRRLAGSRLNLSGSKVTRVTASKTTRVHRVHLRRTPPDQSMDLHRSTKPYLQCCVAVFTIHASYLAAASNKQDKMSCSAAAGRCPPVTMILPGPHFRKDGCSARCLLGRQEGAACNTCFAWPVYMYSQRQRMVSASAWEASGKGPAAHSVASLSLWHRLS